LGASIGHAGYPADGTSGDEVFANADLALYASKSDGGQIVRFELGMRAKRDAERQLLKELRDACDNREFVLFYQPQVDLRTGRLIGAEALIRWRHPRRGLLPPGAFMEAVHASDISDRVANWVLDDACRQAAVWERAGLRLRIGVNLSPSQMRLDIGGLVKGALARHGLSPELIDLEVTENILLADEDAIIGVLKQLRQLGVHLAFDDFGTGFASLTHLKTMPIDRIKIDRSFVQDLTRDSQGAVIVQSIIHMAHALDLEVIAEGIEDPDAVAMLKLIGCDEGQGYLFGRPMPAEALAALATGGPLITLDDRAA
jgi:EAL domain-containing protein (putative c-di-GMP-specific phosphodiesterase class I)